MSAPDATPTRSLADARLEDAVNRAQNGNVAVLPFLSPKEAHEAKKLLLQRGFLECAYFFGGYEGAERVSLFLLPDYLTSCLSAPPEQAPKEELEALLGEELAREVSALRITGSGFRALTHRDYLGSILALGLERDALGDVAVQNDHEAVVFCSSTIQGFLCETLTKVANDSVKCRPYTVDESFTDGRHYQPIHTTVASGRLDCIVAALTDLSRDAAQEKIRSASVELDFEVREETSFSVVPPATLSIRGYGRFLIRPFDGETKKGRLRLFAEKLI